MGLLDSITRRDKAASDAKSGSDPESPKDLPGPDKHRSRSKVSLSREGIVGSDLNQPSQEGESASGRSVRAQKGNFMASMGQSIVFKGELTGDEDLEIDGRVEGTVNLKNHQLTIGANGNVKAEVTAKSIIVIGQVKGNLTATERIEVQATGVVDGDVRAPRLNVQEGAVLSGSIDMSGGGDTKKTATPTSASAAVPPTAPSSRAQRSV